MATLDPDQAKIYGAYLASYAKAAVGQVEAPTEPGNVDELSAIAVGAQDGKAGVSPRWSGQLLPVIRHMKDPSKTGGTVGP